MAKRTTWLKLLCSLSGLSVILSSCFNPESFFSFKNEPDTINLSNITSSDLSVSDKLTHDDLLASDINSSNFPKYFELKLVQKAETKQDLNDLVDIKVGGFSADDSNGILSFIVTLEKRNSNPIEYKQMSLEINGFLKKQKEISQPKDNTDNTKTYKTPDSEESNQKTTLNPVHSTPEQSSPSTPVDESNKLDPSSSSTKLKTFSDQELYKKIYDRTFSLEFYTRYGFHDNSDSMYKELYYVTNGTGWLLDYQVSPQNPDLYRLFLATNLHVAQTLWNSDEFDNPVTDLESRPETIGFSLGKSEDVQFTAQNSRLNNSAVKYATYLDNNAFYNRIPNRANSWRVSGQRLSIPQTVFAAVDFINDQQTKDEFSSHWSTQFRSQFISNTLSDKNLLENTYPKDPEARVEIADKYLEEHGVGLYKDFAVLSVVVNISERKLETDSQRRYRSSKLLRKYVLEAINELNESSRLAKLSGQFNITNQDLPYVDLDYASTEAGQHNALTFEDVNKAYIAGYPGVQDPIEDSKFSYRWVQNNLNEDANYQLEPNINSDLVNKTQDLTGLIQSYHNKYYHQYGITQEVLRSSLRPGSSGSVVYSKYGLPFGIFWGGYSGGDPLTENRRGVFDYFANDTRKSFNISVRFGQNEERKRFMINIEPYNLIDGTNKEKYPNQTNSYRESLAKYLAWTEDDGFSKSTYLFDRP